MAKQFKSRLGQIMLEKSAEAGRRITAQSISEATGITESTLSKWVNGEPMKQVRAGVADALCDYLQVSLTELIYLDEINESDDPENETRSTPNAA